MRTWSVSGTAFALWTRSSSLSIRTSTSMDFRSLQRGPDCLAFPPEAPAAWLRLGLGLGLPRRLGPGRVRSGDPAAAARLQLIEELLRLAPGKHHLVGVGQ